VSGGRKGRIAKVSSGVESSCMQQILYSPLALSYPVVQAGKGRRWVSDKSAGCQHGASSSYPAI